MTNSDAVRLVADVLRQHHWDTTPTFEGEYPRCSCGPSFRYRTDHADHIAAAVVAALGGLTREEQWIPVQEDGECWLPRSEERARKVLEDYGAGGSEHQPDLDSPVVRVEYKARWVSGWTPEETHE